MSKQDNWTVSLAKQLCPICCKEHELIIMPNTLTKKAVNSVKEAQGKVIGFMEEPCNECKEYLDKDLISLIGIIPDKSGSNFHEIYRTGQLLWVNKELVQNIIPNWSNFNLGGFIFVEEQVIKQLQEAYNKHKKKETDNPTNQE